MITKKAMITKEQTEAIMDYIEINFDNICYIIDDNNIDIDRFAEKEQFLEEKVSKLEKSASATKKEIEEAKFEHRRADTMRILAEGFVLAVLLHKINSKIFNDCN